MRFVQTIAIAAGLSATLITALPVASSSENSKRALIAPLSDGKGNGLLETAGEGFDGVITTVAGVVEPVVEGGDSQPEVNAKAKRALVAPLSDGKGNGLLETAGEGLDGAITTIAGVVEPVVEGGDSQPEVNAKRALVAPPQ